MHALSLKLTAAYLTNTLYRFSHTLVKAGYDGNESNYLYKEYNVAV